MTSRKPVLKAGLMAAAIALSISPAFGQMSSDTGWYVGGSLGQSSLDIEGCGGGVECEEKDTAWRILGGYQINRNFAVELGFHQFGDASASAPGERLDFEANAFELVGVGKIPLSSQFSLYGKAGFYRGEMTVSGNTILAGPIDIEETNTDFTYGLGAQYNFSRQIGVRAEWQRYTGMGDDATIGETDVDVLSLGVVVRF